MPKVIFWVLLLLAAIGPIGFRDNPRVMWGSGVVSLILFAILGYYVLGF